MTWVAVLGRRDAGRLVMVPTAAIVLLHDVGSLANIGALTRSGDGALRWAGTALTCVFFALIILCYVRRGPAIATYGGGASRAVAVVATFAPFPLPFLHSAPPGASRQLAADLLLMAGTTGAIWSLWYLGKNVSVIAQARTVADRGPYRLVRHPLYTAELISALGLALAAGTIASYAGWAVLCAMQVYRARCEELILLRAACLPRLSRADPGFRACLSRGRDLSPVSWAARCCGTGRRRSSQR
ncbi:MAG TPA: methyltransferase [Streptosporangiaceae bacterium]|nr:methyltransferase [Streptosporangiaceae bacterium]